jgi:hypothetical protein
MARRPLKPTNKVVDKVDLAIRLSHKRRRAASSRRVGTRSAASRVLSQLGRDGLALALVKRAAIVDNILSSGGL